MADFELFKEVLKEYNSEKKNIISPSECDHFDVSDDNGAIICLDCGQELKRDLNFDKEWRYYGSDDTRRNTDPNRCQMRKSEEKGIFKDVEGMGFSDKIVNIANDIYNQVTKGQIHRGNSRQSIIFACIFQAYKLINKPHSYEDLQSVFKLERKVILSGIKFVSRNVPKESPIRTKYITPVDLIEEIMNKFNFKSLQKQEVVDIYEKVKNRSSILNKSRPQSFAAGLIYYWITQTNQKIDISDFTEKVNLSDITINKISKEIATILERIN